MTKLNLNAIENYDYLTPQIAYKLKQELRHHLEAQTGARKRIQRIKTILNKPVKEKT